jgi:hypothetical protein
MPAMLDATDSQMAMLGDLVTTLEAIEATVSGMQAARDGLLALAARLAIDIAQQGRHPDQGDMALRAVAAEIGAAQRVSDRTIERRMTEASRRGSSKSSRPYGPRRAQGASPRRTPE